MSKHKRKSFDQIVKILVDILIEETKKFYVKIVRFLVVGGYIIVGIGFLGNIYYFFDLFSHFYLQYFILGIIILILSIISRDKKAILSCIVMLIFLGVNINKAEINLYNPPLSSDYYYLNANYGIHKPEEILTDIKKYNPKYVVIVELNEELHSKILEEFKFSNVLYHSKQGLSFAFYTNQEIIYKETHSLTYPVGEVKTKDSTVFIVHPLPPMDSIAAVRHRRNIEEFSKLFHNNRDDKKMIIGDFNASFYSPLFKKYFGKLYYNPVYSWSSNKILRIPIDYAIGNKDFFTVNGSPMFASDHSPLLINLHPSYSLKAK